MVDHLLVGGQSEVETANPLDFFERIEVMPESVVGTQRFGPLLGDGLGQDMVGREQDIADADAKVPRRMSRRVDELQSVEFHAVFEIRVDGTSFDRFFVEVGGFPQSVCVFLRSRRRADRKSPNSRRPRALYWRPAVTTILSSGWMPTCAG